MATAARGQPVPRREFLAKTGLVGAATALAQLPGILGARGWLDIARAQELDLTKDTLNGLVVFISPGDDEYSVAQGETSNKPGAMEANTTENLILNLDNFLPAADVGMPSDDTLPISGAVANLLNTMAAQVNPVAAGGPFPSHFSRLSFAEKAEVFHLIETTPGTDPASSQLRFVGGILPGFTAFLAFCEWHVFDPKTKKLTGRPVGWKLSDYQPNGPVRGWDEFKGYYQGRRKAQD
jgi:hypothetical protein